MKIQNEQIQSEINQIKSKLIQFNSESIGQYRFIAYLYECLCHVHNQNCDYDIRNEERIDSILAKYYLDFEQ